MTWKRYDSACRTAPDGVVADSEGNQYGPPAHTGRLDIDKQATSDFRNLRSGDIVTDQAGNQYRIEEKKMITFDTMAKRVAGNMHGNPRLNPAFIQLIAMFLQEILPKLLENCGETPESVVAAAKNPGRFQKFWLKRQTRKAFGRRTYREDGDAIAAATLKTTKKAKPAELAALYEQVS